MKIKTGIKRVASNIEEDIVVESYIGRYPYRELVVKVWGEATKKGKATKEYRDIKHRLGDDWFSDLTNHWWEEHSCLSVPDIEKLDRIIQEITL